MGLQGTGRQPVLVVVGALLVTRDRKSGASNCFWSCADLVPREVAEAWLTYLREELPTVAFKCSTQKQVHLLHRHLLVAFVPGEARCML